MGVGCSHEVVEHTPDFLFHGASPLTLSKYGLRVCHHATCQLEFIVHVRLLHAIYHTICQYASHHVRIHNPDCYMPESTNNPKVKS